jgi:hypothetical protein
MSKKPVIVKEREAAHDFGINKTTLTEVSRTRKVLLLRILQKWNCALVLHRDFKWSSISSELLDFAMVSRKKKYWNLISSIEFLKMLRILRQGTISLLIHYIISSRLASLLFIIPPKSYLLKEANTFRE